MRLLPRAEYLVVATESRVVVETVRRTVRLLRELRVPVLGVVANIAGPEAPGVRALASESAIPFLGAVPRDPEVEPATGDPARLLATSAAAALREIAS